MFIFLDKSGDCGMKERNSAARFTLAAICFEALEHVEACETRIAQVRADLGLVPHFEFHFVKIADAIRHAFLKEVAATPFLYATCTVEKTRATGRQWKDKAFFFEKVTESIVGDLEEYLHIAQACKKTPLNGKLTADNNGDKVYLNVIGKQFRKPKSPAGRSLIETVRFGTSKTSSLLQLADMVCGSVVRSLDGENEYRTVVGKREVAVRVIPK